MNNPKEIYDLISEELRRYSKAPISDFSVNCFANKDYPRDCYRNFQTALSVMKERGEGFNIGGSVSGGWAYGALGGTGDITTIIKNPKI